MTKGDRLSPINLGDLFSHGHMRSHDKLKTLHFIFSYEKRMASKLSRVDAYGERLSAAKWFYHLIIRSCSKWKIQMKIKIFILQDSRTTKLWLEEA